MAGAACSADSFLSREKATSERATTQTGCHAYARVSMRSPPMEHAHASVGMAPRLFILLRWIETQNLASLHSVGLLLPHHNGNVLTATRGLRYSPGRVHGKKVAVENAWLHGGSPRFWATRQRLSRRAEHSGVETSGPESGVSPSRDQISGTPNALFRVWEGLPSAKHRTWGPEPSPRGLRPWSK